MRLKDRLQRKSEQSLMCPVCGQTGIPEEEAPGTTAAFALRGEVDGHPARRCFVCGSGFVVVGTNTEPIPAIRWAEIEARYDEMHSDDGSTHPSPDSRR